MIENGHSALESPMKLHLERLNHFPAKTPGDTLKQGGGEISNWDSPSLPSCNSNASSQSTAIRSLQPPDLGQWPLMQVFLTNIFMNPALAGHQNRGPPKI